MRRAAGLLLVLGFVAIYAAAAWLRVDRLLWTTTHPLAVALIVLAAAAAPALLYLAWRREWAWLVVVAALTVPTALTAVERYDPPVSELTRLLAEAGLLERPGVGRPVDRGCGQTPSSCAFEWHLFEIFVPAQHPGDECRQLVADLQSRGWRWSGTWENSRCITFVTRPAPQPGYVYVLHVETAPNGIVVMAGAGGPHSEQAY